jgi:nucleotide-binding universal stress UspA family protein
MFECIIVPLDGSDLAEQALAQATSLAKGLGSKLVLVQAIDSLAQRMGLTQATLEAPSAAAANVDLLQQALEAEKAEAERYLAAKRTELGAAGLKVEAYVGEGPAADVILRVAEDQGAGLIAMSTHGRGGLGRLVFGSVADAVLRRSEIPILVKRSSKSVPEP